jgi:putative membrane protein
VSNRLVVLAAVALTGWAYARGRRHLSERAHASGPRRGPAVCFGAGLAAVVVALATPLDHLTTERLWAHMAQHVVLVAVAAPLLVLGRPLPTLLWAIPAGARAEVSRWWRRLARSHSRPAGWLAWAAGALALHSLNHWAWHAPGPYQAALRSESVHALEHATFLGTGLLFWWAVVGARRRALYGAGVLITFFAALQGTALGAFMTMAARPWYPAYAQNAGAGLTPLEDQQVAGVIMWGPGGLVYALAAVLLFAAWIGRLDAAPHGPAAAGGPRPTAGARTAVGGVPRTSG